MDEPTNTEGTSAPTTEAPKGAFFSTLTRNNKKIRSDRAEAIHEDAESIYRRTIEDLRRKQKQLTRQRDNALDLSPTDATSLTLADDFDATNFVAGDINIGMKIDQIERQLVVATTRYQILFGEAI